MSKLVSMIFPEAADRGSEHQLVARLEDLRKCNPVPVDEGSVEAGTIVQDDLVAQEFEIGVVPRNLRAQKNDVVPEVATDAYLRLPERVEDARLWTATNLDVAANGWLASFDDLENFGSLRRSFGDRVVYDVPDLRLDLEAPSLDAGVGPKSNPDRGQRRQSRIERRLVEPLRQLGSQRRTVRFEGDEICGIQDNDKVIWRHFTADCDDFAGLHRFAQPIADFGRLNRRAKDSLERPLDERLE